MYIIICKISYQQNSANQSYIFVQSNVLSSILNKCKVLSNVTVWIYKLVMNL